MYNFKLNTAYSFNTHAPALLGSRLNNATVLAVMDYTLASQFIQPEASHANVFPMLPAGTLDNPKSFSYILLRTESGERTVLAYPWIDESSIAEVTSQSLTVTIQNASAEDATKIRTALVLAGFPNVTITVTQQTN